jgi:hypothetical protein
VFKAQETSSNKGKEGEEQERSCRLRLLATSGQISSKAVKRNAINIALSTNENIRLDVICVGAAMHTQCRPECLCKILIS